MWFTIRPRQHDTENAVVEGGGSRSGSESISRPLADDTLLLRELLRFSHGVDVPANVRSDCLSLVRNAHSCSRSVRQKSVTPDLNALHEMLVAGDIASIEFVPSRLNPADGTTKPDHTLRIPILRLLAGKDVLWRHDPLITGLIRPRPAY